MLKCRNNRLNSQLLCEGKHKWNQTQSDQIYLQPIMVPHQNGHNEKSSSVKNFKNKKVFQSLTHFWLSVDIMSPRPFIPTKCMSITFSKLSIKNLLKISDFRLSSGVSKHKTVVTNGFKFNLSHNKNRLVKSRFISYKCRLFRKSVAPIEMSTFFLRTCNRSFVCSRRWITSANVIVWLQYGIFCFANSSEIDQKPKTHSLAICPFECWAALFWLTFQYLLTLHFIHHIINKTITNDCEFEFLCFTICCVC